MIFLQGAKDPANAQNRADELVRAVRESRLLALILETTSTCNLMCSFCDLHARKSEFGDRMKPRMLMRYDLFEEIVRQLQALPFRFKEISMHGVGEPLMNKRIHDMVRAVKGAEVADRVTLSTNGILMSPDKLEKLVEAGIDEIVVSLDTVDPDRYIELKGRKMGPLLENIDHALRVLEGHPQVTFMIKCIDPRGIYDLQSQDADGVIETYRRAAEHSSNIHIKIVPEFTWPVASSEGRPAEQHSPCEIPFYQMTIHADGKVSCCCLDITHELNVGQIGKGGTLSDIIDGDPWRKVKRTMLSGNLESLPMCLTCNSRSVTNLDARAAEISELIGQAV